RPSSSAEGMGVHRIRGRRRRPDLGSTCPGEAAVPAMRRVADMPSTVRADHLEHAFAFGVKPVARFKSMSVRTASCWAAESAVKSARYLDCEYASSAWTAATYDGRNMDRSPASARSM